MIRLASSHGWDSRLAGNPCKAGWSGATQAQLHLLHSHEEIRRDFGGKNLNPKP